MKLNVVYICLVTLTLTDKDTDHIIVDTSFGHRHIISSHFSIEKMPFPIQKYRF